MKDISIDSSNIHEVTIELRTEKARWKEKKQARNIKGSQVILQTIDELLHKEHVKLSEIQEINVHGGPGSYTGLRVGAAIANTLAFSLGIPVNKKKVGEFVYPTYE